VVRQSHERQIIERAEFDVAGILTVKTFQCRGVRFDAVGMSHFGFFLKEGGGSIKVTLLPWICGVKFLSSLNVFAALFQNFVIREVPKLVKPGHRPPPVGDSALRVALSSFGESLFGL